MSRRFQTRSTPGNNLRAFMSTIPWKLLIVLPILVVVAVPTYLIGTHLGGNVMPSLTSFFYKVTDISPDATPTPQPPLTTILPRVGPVLYTVEDGDSCDSILTFQMRMNKAGEIFTDVRQETVKALNAALGHDCGKLQPGTVLSLMPHYPLAALGGTVLKIEATSPQQVLPTPLIKVTSQPQSTVDCSGGCLLTVRVSAQTQVKVLVETGLPVRPGSWIWAQVALARKKIHGFDNYPYVDPNASLNGSLLHACDLQVDNTHDDNGTTCDELNPNTIDDDGGSWLVGVVGPGGLDHWRYPVHQPPGTRIMLWLTVDPRTGNLKYQPGNPVYRYDDASHIYVKISK